MENELSKGVAVVAATVPSVIGQFCTMEISLLKEMGYTVHVATNFRGTSNWSIERNNEFKSKLESEGVQTHQIAYSRSPLAIKEHVTAFRQMRKLIRHNDVRLVHVSTPIAGALCRLSALFSRVKVVYMAHGFHFYRGAPVRNWLIYYPIEWLCSFNTETLITINLEDYERAEKHLHARRIRYVPGVGVDCSRFAFSDGERIKSELGLSSKDKLIVSIGELNKNKNHEAIIHALRYLPKGVHYAIAGDGALGETLRSIAVNEGVSSRLHLMGYRTDVQDILGAADVFALPSLREGLNVSLMEAMASGLVCVCKAIRGNVDLIDEGLGGILVKDDTPAEWARCLERALTMDRVLVAEHNKSKMKGFSKVVVENRLRSILKESLSTV